MNSMLFEDILQSPREGQLVKIGAFCLMPNHYHLLLQPLVDNGISEFMRKLGIAYTTYFNTKYERVGNLFVKPFRSRHISSDTYFQHVINYIHLNPAELKVGSWKLSGTKNVDSMISFLESYAYSSFVAHRDPAHLFWAILDTSIMKQIQTKGSKEMVRSASEYYKAQSQQDVILLKN